MNLQKHFIPMEGMTFKRLLRFFLPLFPHQKPYQLHQATKGEYIYSPNQNRTHLYLLQKGRVKIGTQVDECQQHLQHIVWEDELFGESVLLGQNPSNGFAQALEEVEYYTIEVEAIRQLFTQNWMVRLQILGAINKRLQSAESRLLAQQTQDTRTRIVDFLLYIAKERGSRVGKYGYFVAPFFKQTDIAALTGCSLPAVGLVLRKLKKEGLISYNSRQLRVYNIHELKHWINTHSPPQPPYPS
ncbi:MAG: Crp/Fnr family transcriptional regulator [Chitinophagales bacterium]